MPLKIWSVKQFRYQRNSLKIFKIFSPFILASLLKQQWTKRKSWDKFKFLEQAYKTFGANPDTFLPPESEEKFGDGWNEIYGNTLPPLALYHFLNGDTESFDLIKQSLERYVNYKSWYPAKDEGIGIWVDYFYPPDYFVVYMFFGHMFFGHFL